MFSSISFPAMPLWFLGLLLAYSFSTPTTCIAITSNETDFLALLAIKSQLHDPLGVTSSWNNSVSLCQWRGITCGHRHQRVTELYLRNQSIGGQLSTYVGNLSFLRYFDIGDNGFYGKIPREFGRLFRLEILLLSNNSFSGTIPTNLSRCSNLIEFYAFKNNLIGEIPSEFGYLSKIEKLIIGENNLTGQLPAFIGNLSVLQVIDLRTNNLGGRISENLGQLRRLAYFVFPENKFSGIFPPSFYNISSLETFDIDHNRLNGSIPINIGFLLPNLNIFSIYGNHFTGSLPYSFSNATNLVRLYLGNNYFTGKVSIDFSGLKNLTDLHLEENNLGTGKANDLDFISSLTNCSRLVRLDLSQNQFGGRLPHSIANLSTTVTLIWLDTNRLTGTIPSGMGNLVNLYGIDLGINQLSGNIPHAIGDLKNLQFLSLYENNLQGDIPTSLGNLTLLTQLWLDSNNLQGNIPSSLESCQNLMELNISKNRLTGKVPQQIFAITTLSILLDLSNNLLSGHFPLEVGKMINLLTLDISRNLFSGEIPVTLSSCTSLEYLYMNDNSFNGSIPSSLSSLKSIKGLDMSCNNFSGQIPKYLENLSLLEYLNLSYNHLNGEVPTKGVFSSATGISLIGNERLCGGSDKLRLPSCYLRESHKPVVTLLKVVIPVTMLCLILLACFVVLLTRRRKSAHKSSTTLEMKEQFPMVSYAELSKATNKFSLSNMIGKGGYGLVYKGILGQNEMLVAVKVLNLQQKGASRSFLAECEALRNIRHRNLIKIITICSSIDFNGNGFKALVFDYMLNGSLEDWLHQSNNQFNAGDLSLIHRLNIVIDVASAIEYLHHHCQPPIVHGDLKPSNVLLDHDMVAHVSDFGLARFLFDRPLGTAPETKSSSIAIKGTPGYVAPEYGMGGGVSMSGDVYSFGILLLEMFTRRRPTDNTFNDGSTIHEFVKLALPEKVMEIVDPSLLLEVRGDNFASHGDRSVRMKQCFISVLTIGILCSVESPSERMWMTDVVAKLRAASKNFLSRRI